MKKTVAMLISVLLLTSCSAQHKNRDIISQLPDTELSSSMEESADISSQTTSNSKSGSDKKKVANYKKIVGNKMGMIEIAHKVVSLYKDGVLPEDGNLYPQYPPDFPPASDLPNILTEYDFAIRLTVNSEDQEIVYIAVPIGRSKEYEIHIALDMEQVSNAHPSDWTTIVVSFQKLSALEWNEQDIDLYAIEESIEKNDEQIYVSGEDVFYLELVEDKELLVDIVNRIVEAYRNGNQWTNTNHYKTSPEDFPPPSELCKIQTANDFAIRFAGDPDALGSVYIAVPIGDSHKYELHICVDSVWSENGKPAFWSETNADFKKVDELEWHKQDIDLYVD